MIVPRHAPVKRVDLFGLVPKLLLDFEPVLDELDRLLDDDEIVRGVAADMATRAPRSLTRGRPSTPVEAVLRLLVVRRLYDWSYAQTEHFVGDSLVLRQFCRVYLEPVPDDTTLIRWARCVGPQTLVQLHERVVALARQAKVTRGRKLRVDGTVVETTIHYPTDSSLLADGVRVVSRLLRRAKALVGNAGNAGNAGEACAALFRDRTRSATRLARQIQDTVRHRGHATQAATAGRQATYCRLLQVAHQSLRQARQLHAVLVRTLVRSARTCHRLRRTAQTARVGQALAHVGSLVEQVIDQTERRVLRGEAVPATEKVVSLFEPHTRIIRRGKVHLPAEFGHKVWVDEVDGGIISRYAVLDHTVGDDMGSTPSEASEAQQVPVSLAHHQRLFGQPPAVLAGDRGVYSAEGERVAHASGVRHVALPQPGAKSASRRCYERQRWFRRAHRFRAGVEGRISVLKRRGSLGRCRDHGERGFACWIGWGILTANLTTIARAQAPPTMLGTPT
jgi:transposase, IS5 family